MDRPPYRPRQEKAANVTYSKKMRGAMTALEKRFAKACKAARQQWKALHEYLLEKRPGGDFGVTALGDHFNIPQRDDVVVFGVSPNRFLSARVVHWAMNRQGSITAVWVGVDIRTVRPWSGLKTPPPEVYTSDDTKQLVFPIELTQYVLGGRTWARWKF